MTRRWQFKGILHIIVSIYLTLTLPKIADAMSCADIMSVPLDRELILPATESRLNDTADHLKDEAIYRVPRLHDSLTSLHDFAERRYGKKLGPLIINRLSKIGKDFESLVSDVGLVFRLDEFQEYMKSVPGQSLTPQEARELFARHLGITRVYRGVALTSEQAKRIRNIGFQTQKNRMDPLNQFYDDRLPYNLRVPLDRAEKIRNSVRNINTVVFARVKSAAIGREYDEVNSVSAHQFIAEVFGAREAYEFHWMAARQLPTGKGIYVFEIDVPEIELIYLNKNNLLLNYSGTKFSYFDETIFRFEYLGKTQDYVFGRDVESFVVGDIPPDWIKRDEEVRVDIYNPPKIREIPK
jgi:hypothetical protein